MSTHELRVCDLNAIESRVIGWLSGCDRLNRVFAEGLDPYKDFATELYRKPYDAISRKERNNSKPAVLGCLGADTLVLTPRGFIRIVSLLATDLVHDGTGWVAHGGLIAQGERAVFRLFGLAITADHKVLTREGWQEAWALSQDIQSVRSGLSLAAGSLKGNYERVKASSTMSAAAPGVVTSKTSTVSTLKKESADLARLAPMRQYEKKKGRSTFRSLPQDARWWTDWQTATTLFSPVVAAEDMQRRVTKVEVFAANFQTSTLSLGTASSSRGTPTDDSNWTESTTTDTTLRGMSASFQRAPTTETKRSTAGSTIWGNAGRRSIFGNDSRHATANPARFAARFAKEKAQRKSSTTSGFVKALTYDILNAGPLNRFVVLTDAGPLVVHNCGFGLGGGAEIDGKRTGLWGYAERMGIALTKDESHAAVKVWRETYEEVPALWRRLEQTAKACMTSGRTVEVNARLRWERRQPYLMLRLPSGRAIPYMSPRLMTFWFAKHPTRGEVRPLGSEKSRADLAKSRGWEVYSKVNLTYMGKPQNRPGWVRLPTHAGKITENAVQAIARDVLKEGLLRAGAAGFDIRLHVYDEIGTWQRRDDTEHTVARLAECMTAPIAWAPGLLLAAGGWSGPFYRKD